MATSEINFGETYGNETPSRPENFENWSLGDKKKWISENEGEVVPDQKETTHSKRGKWANTVLERAEQAKQAKQAQDTIGLEAPETLESKIPGGTQQSEVAVPRPVKPVLGFDVVSLSNAVSPESTSLASAVRNLAGVFSSTGNNIELIRGEDFTNLSEQEKIKAYDNIARAFRALVMKTQKEIKDFFQGIKIRLVEGAMNSAVYDESEKVLTIRADAEPTHIYQYVTDTVIPILKEEKLLVKNSTPQEKQDVVVEEGVSQEDPILDKPAVEPQAENMGELLGSTQLDQDREGLREPKNNGIEFGRVDLSNYDPKKSTEEYDLKVEIDGALQDLEENERRILKDSNFKIITKGEEVVFPVYMEEANTLDVGFLNTGEDILNAIRNTVLPYLKDKTAVEPQVESVEESPEATQLGNVEEVADNVEQAVQNPEKERILQELSSIRSELAEMDALTHNYSGKTGKSFFVLKDEYNSKKEELLKQIGAEIRGSEVYGPLTPEQEKLVKSKFDDELYKVLKSENDSYNASIKAARGENILDKAKESFRGLLGTKSMKWYAGLTRGQRFALNTTIFSLIAAGVAFAAPTGTLGAAVSAGGYRLARGIGAFVGSGFGMGLSNKILKPEQLQEWKTQEEQKIKDSEGSVEEKSKRIEELEKEFDRRLRNLNLKKIGMAALAGGITSAVSGGLFNSYYSGTGGGAAENLVKPKTAPSESTEVPKMRPVEAVKPEITENADSVDLQEMFGANYKEAMLQNVPKEGSLWGITREALLNNERFAALSVGQKNNVLAYYSNKILNSPEKFGFEADPKYGVKLEVGKPVDLSEAFDDKAEFEKVISRAERMSPELEAQEVQRATEIENSYKVTPEPSEIPKTLSSDIEDSPVSNKGIFSETERAAFMSGSLEKIDRISEKINQLRELGVDIDRIKVLEDKILELKNSVNYVKDNYTGPGGRVDVIDDVLGTSKKIDGLQSEVEKLIEEEIRNKTGSLQDNRAFPQREVLEDEIRNARGRLEQLERDSKIVEPSNRGIINPDTLRTMRGDTNNLIRNINNGGDLSSLDTAVERAFNNDIQRAYGSEGFLGLRKVIGANTKDWGLMKGLSANEVIKYFTDDSADTKLPPNVVSELAKSAKHKEFGDQLLGLIEMTDGNVKPYENENVADFTKRLGRFVMEKHSQGVSNIKSPMKMVA